MMEMPDAAPDRLDIRASDADRERVADLLRRHFSEGRISLDELQERLGEVYAAKTTRQLDAPIGALRELPTLAPPQHSDAVPTARFHPRPTYRSGRTFAEHATSYLLVNLVLIGVWAVTGDGYFWPGWVLFGWGIGLASHGVSAWHNPPADSGST